MSCNNHVQLPSEIKVIFMCKTFGEKCTYLLLKEIVKIKKLKILRVQGELVSQETPPPRNVTSSNNLKKDQSAFILILSTMKKGDKLHLVATVYQTVYLSILSEPFTLVRGRQQSRARSKVDQYYTLRIHQKKQLTPLYIIISVSFLSIFNVGPRTNRHGIPCMGDHKILIRQNGGISKIQVSLIGVITKFCGQISPNFQSLPLVLNVTSFRPLKIHCKWFVSSPKLNMCTRRQNKKEKTKTTLS